MDTRVYKSLLAPLLGNHTTYHHSVPCHNLVCLEKLTEVSKNFHTENSSQTGSEADVKNFDTFPFYQSFNYETDSCIVLYPGLTKTDKAYEYVFRKSLWYKKLVRYMPKDYEKIVMQLKQQKIFDVQNMDRKLFKFLQWLLFDHDDQFFGDYNWLYTGGNIAGFQYNNEYWLITPDEFQQSTFLCVSRLSPDFNSIRESNKRPMRINLCHNQPVHQIITKLKTDDVFIAVRHKDWISIKKLNNSCEIIDIWDLKTFKRNRCSNYVTTCDLSNDCRYLSLMSGGGNMAVFDVEVETPIFSWSEQWDFMQWSRVLFDKAANEVYLADRHSLKIFDLRGEKEPKFVYTPTAVTNECERIRNFFGSEFRENIFYITTSHSLIEMDIRTGKNLQRWTHLMEFAPQFGDISRRGDKELIILQSNDSSELIGIQNEGLNDKFAYSKSSPYLFSTVQDELRKARLHGFGLHENVSQRLNFHVTGLHVAMSSEGKDTVFTVNGGGDVVMTKLTESEPDIKKKEADHCISLNSRKSFEKLETRCCDLQTEKKCEYRTAPLSSIDFKRVLPVFEKVEARETSSRRRRKRSQDLSCYWLNSEMYSPENLCCREGGFYDKFLLSWGINVNSLEPEDDASENGKEDEKIRESRAKVEQWMK